MLQSGPATKVTIHLNEDTPSSRDFLHNEIFAFLFDSGVSGATLVRPEAGFGSHHRLHRLAGDHLAAEHMPVRIEFIEHPEVVSALMPKLCEMVTDGIIEAQDTVVWKATARTGPRF